MRMLVKAIFLAGLLGLATPAVAAAAQSEPVEQVAKGQKRRGKGSGFWTSDVPTPNRPYRWTYMAIGGTVMLLMGGVVVLLIRRANRQREATE